LLYKYLKTDCYGYLSWLLSPLLTSKPPNKQNIFIPDGVWDNIFSYFHSSYKKPSHFVAWEQAKTTNPGDDYTVYWMNSLGLDADALNIWYDVRTGYIHNHIKKIRRSYDELLPYDQCHEDEIEDQGENKEFLLDELRDFIEESNDINVRLLPLIVECNRL